MVWIKRKKRPQFEGRFFGWYFLESSSRQQCREDDKSEIVNNSGLGLFLASHASNGCLSCNFLWNLLKKSSKLWATKGNPLASLTWFKN